jgi:2-polyprenyl-3-methyl-5-hydroxy-6-metoxy-1,4-benzoquinol methylase
MADNVPEYHYSDVTCWSDYLWPSVKEAVERHIFKQRRAFDLGCGNGSVSKRLHDLGFQIVGVDLSESAIRVASANYPQLKFYKGDAYSDLAASYGQFPLVVSLEVVEHCYDPRRFARTLYTLVEEGGIAIVSTPYHGYLKNLALAIGGKWNEHLDPLWDGGHIKFFSEITFRTLLSEAGFRDIRVVRVGRIPALAKSMIAVARK